METGPATVHAVNSAMNELKSYWNKRSLIKATMLVTCVIPACTFSFAMGAILYCAHFNRERLKVNLLWDLGLYEAIQQGDIDYAKALVAIDMVGKRNILLELEKSSKNVAYIENRARFPEDVRREVFEKIDEIHRNLPREGVTNSTGAIVLP